MDFKKIFTQTLIGSSIVAGIAIPAAIFISNTPAMEQKQKESENNNFYITFTTHKTEEVVYEGYLSWESEAIDIGGCYDGSPTGDWVHMSISAGTYDDLNDPSDFVGIRGAEIYNYQGTSGWEVMGDYGLGLAFLTLENPVGINHSEIVNGESAILIGLNDPYDDLYDYNVWKLFYSSEPC